MPMRFAAALFLVVAGCGKADEALKALEDVRGAVCGCKPTDTACQQAGVAKIEAWHGKYDEVMGARSQSAKATAHLEAMTTCQTSQTVSAIAERAGCDEKDATSPWCLVDGWSDAKPVEAGELPFGKALTGEAQQVTVGTAPVADPAPDTLELAGDAKAPTANGAAMTADGASWTWKEHDLDVALRKVDGGWMTLASDGDVRHVAVYPEPE